jgi:SRSO17 transposase
MFQCRQTKPSQHFYLVLDDSGHRKSGSETDGVGRQYLGEIGKVDNGMVLVSTHLVDGVRRLPLDLALYQHGSSLPAGKQDPDFVKKPDLAVQLVERCLHRGMHPELVLADSAYGTNTKFVQQLEQRQLHYIVGLAKNRRVHYQLPEEQEGHKHTITEVAHSLPEEQFVAVNLAGEKPRRVWVAVVKVHVSRLGERWIAIVRDGASWEASEDVDYLMSNVPVEQMSEAWIVRTYQQRNWVEVFYREAKGWLGLREYQVREKRAIHRHWYLVFAAYTFIHWQQLTGGLRRRWATQRLESFAEALEAFRTGIGYRLVKWIAEHVEAFTAHKAAAGYRWAW